MLAMYIRLSVQTDMIPNPDRAENRTLPCRLGKSRVRDYRAKSPVGHEIAECS